MSENRYDPDDLNFLAGDVGPPSSASEDDDRSEAHFETLMDGTNAFGECFLSRDDPLNPYRVPSPERHLIEDVTTTLTRALDARSLTDVSNEDLLVLVRRLDGKRLVFYIAKGMVFLALRARFRRERDFFKYIKDNTSPDDHLQTRSIQTYMRICRLFWLELTSDQQGRFCHYYERIPLDRLELIGRDEHRQKWFFGNDAIILQDCRGAGSRIEGFRNLGELKEALLPVMTTEESAEETEWTPPDSQEDPPAAPDFTPVATRTYETQRAGVEIRLEGINIVQTEDGTVEALPGARLAVWLECVPESDRETQRRIHVYDGDLGEWHEVPLNDYGVE